MMLDPAFLSLSILTLIISYYGVAGVRRWSESRGIMDIPNERSSHSRPVPRGGGAVIVVASLLGWLLLGLVYRVYPPPILFAYPLAAVFVALVSWLDDLRPMPTLVRFSVHGLGAALIILSFGYLDGVLLPYFGFLPFAWAGVPLTFIWIVGLTNAYNFMDGIDGIAGGQGAVAGLGWFFLGWLSGEQLLGALGLILAASSLGFLAHNWSPARIFMGDVGSTFLGFTFAVLPVIALPADPRLLAAGLILVWPFVFDTAFTFFRRALRGEKVFTAHRSHLYQRLVIAGWSHRLTALLYIALSAAGAVTAALWYAGAISDELTVMVMAALALLLWLTVQITALYNRVSVWYIDR
jgi:UDP-GlcNAc:undecaprenyl-phosphate/decaprenyl-phosphate GlcNAc-1-phosphate transferase